MAPTCVPPGAKNTSDEMAPYATEEKQLLNNNKKAICVASPEIV